MKGELHPHIAFPEPPLAFHPDRDTDWDVHPLRGLIRFGPYSANLVPDPIRVATLTPAGDSQRLYDFMSELKTTCKATERVDYLVEWPGFPRVFGVRVRGAGTPCHAELPESLDEELLESASPQRILASTLLRSIQALEAHRPSFDILFILLPARWRHAFQGGSGDDFDLHDHLKAYTAGRGLPVQIVREDKALAYPHRASVMWRVGLAIYAKAGGVPWKIAEHDPETAYIGISYALRSPESDLPRFVTCCSQVFDAEGAGLEFIAYDAHDVEIQRDNPFLSRTEMFRVMTRSLDLYRRRHAGRSPRRVMIHKTSEFKRDEVDGALEAMHLCESVDLIQVVREGGWRAARIGAPRGNARKGQPAMFPVSRGTTVGLGDREALLWSHGDVSNISPRGSYFQGSRGTPAPLRLVRFAGHGPWDDTARSILALSKMNWNNDALYDSLPVTMRYAEVLARVVRRIPTLGTTPYQFRFFM